MTADFDISFFAYMRITFLRNCSCSDNLLKDMNNNTANAVNYISCAENRYVKKFYEKLIRTYASQLVTNHVQIDQRAKFLSPPLETLRP